MRDRNELYNILVGELKLDHDMASEILHNALKEQGMYIQIDELREKFVGKLLCIEKPCSWPVYLFLNKIEETSDTGDMTFIGPYIEVLDYSYSEYCVGNDYGNTPLTMRKEDIQYITVINDIGNIALTKKQFIKEFLYYQVLGKKVESCLNKFIERCNC